MTDQAFTEWSPNTGLGALSFVEGRVLDPASGTDALGAIHVTDGRISKPQEGSGSRTGATVIDASNTLVVPGLIDLHAHIYSGVSPIAVDADAVAARGGVSTMVSAGDAGASTIDGFRRLVVDQVNTRIYSFLHISLIGMAGWPVGEAINRDYLDVDAAVSAAEANRDIIVGFKVRQSSPGAVGNLGLLPLRRALAAGERAELPVMVHIGSVPGGLPQLLVLLRPGDIVTHCFTGAANGIVRDGRLLPEVWSARERGVLFDLGHGLGSFSFDVAEVAAREGFWPDVISTDLHNGSEAVSIVDLPDAMSKMLAVGMPIDDVVAAVTANPAIALNRVEQIGSLAPGREADVTLLRVAPGPFIYTDTHGQTRQGVAKIEIVQAVRGGRMFTHPGH